MVSSYCRRKHVQFQSRDYLIRPGSPAANYEVGFFVAVKSGQGHRQITSDVENNGIGSGTSTKQKIFQAKR